MIELMGRICATSIFGFSSSMILIKIHRSNQKLISMPIRTKRKKKRSKYRTRISTHLGIFEISFFFSIELNVTGVRRSTLFCLLFGIVFSIYCLILRPTNLTFFDDFCFLSHLIFNGMRNVMEIDRKFLSGKSNEKLDLVNEINYFIQVNYVIETPSSV